MFSFDFDDFEEFAKTKRGKFRAIARATQGEHTVEDVQNEALLAALEVAEKDGVPVAFRSPAFQDRVIAFLYQRLIRYADTTIRWAVKLDKAIDGEDLSADDHPAIRQLSAAQDNDPLTLLLEREQTEEALAEPSPHESRASAYLHLLRRCDNRMRRAAEHLLISLSYCYRRFNEAKNAVIFQLDLPTTLRDEAFIPRSWRSFRIMIPWTQLELDLGNEPGRLGI